MTISSSYYPGTNRLLVKELPAPKLDTILTFAESPYKYAQIEAVGPIKDRKDIGEDLFKTGDYVYFLSQAGLVIDLKGGTYRLLTITDILVGEKGEQNEQNN